MLKRAEPTKVQSVKVPYSQLWEIELMSLQTGLTKHRIMRQAITEFLANRTVNYLQKSSEAI